MLPKSHKILLNTLPLTFHEQALSWLPYNVANPVQPWFSWFSLFPSELLNVFGDVLVDSVRPTVQGGMPTIQHFDIIRWRNRGLGNYPLREFNHSKWLCSRSSEGTLRQITLTAGANLIRWTSCKLWKAATSGPLLQRNCWVMPTRWIGWTNKSSFCQVLFKVGVLLRMTENFDFFRFFYRFFFAGINYLKIIDAHFFSLHVRVEFFFTPKNQVKIIWTHFTSQFVTIRELFSVTFSHF